jgi:hypothetical protein
MDQAQIPGLPGIGAPERVYLGTWIGTRCCTWSGRDRTGGCDVGWPSGYVDPRVAFTDSAVQGFARKKEKKIVGTCLLVMKVGTLLGLFVGNIASEKTDCSKRNGIDLFAKLQFNPSIP